MSDKPMTEEDFAEKVQWEGGVIDALEYGLKAEHVEPGDLRNDWAVLASYYDDMHEILEVVEAHIEDLAEAP